MDSWQISRKLDGQNSTVAELRDLRKPSTGKLTKAKRSLGEEGLQALEEKQANIGGGLRRGPKTEFSDDETAYLEAKAVVEVYDKAIEERQALDSILVDPDAFKGFLDQKFVAEIKKGHSDIFKEPVFNESFAELLNGLKGLRRPLGLQNAAPEFAISKEAALEVARELESSAGLKNVASIDPEDDKSIQILLKQIRKEIDALGFKPDKPPMWDSHEATVAGRELEHQKSRVIVGIMNNFNLDPIEPVRYEFGKSVDTMVGLLPQAFDHGPAEAIIGKALAESPELRTLLKTILRDQAENLRKEAHVVVTNIPDMKGVGGS